MTMYKIKPTVINVVISGTVFSDKTKIFDGERSPSLAVEYAAAANGGFFVELSKAEVTAENKKQKALAEKAKAESETSPEDKASAAQKIVDEKAEAAQKILDDAKAAQKILDDAKAAQKILDDAKAEKGKAEAEASKLELTKKIGEAKTKLVDLKVAALKADASEKAKSDFNKAQGAISLLEKELSELK